MADKKVFVKKNRGNGKKKVQKKTCKMEKDVVKLWHIIE